MPQSPLASLGGSGIFLWTTRSPDPPPGSAPSSWKRSPNIPIVLYYAPEPFQSVRKHNQISSQKKKKFCSFSASFCESYVCWLHRYVYYFTLFCCDNILLKELHGMRNFNFVNFKNLIYMKLYNLLIINEIQKHKKNKVKAPKKTKLALFPRHILSCKQGVQDIRQHILTRWHDQSKPHDYINSCHS